MQGKTIEQAYAELSPQAFAIWMRLHTISNWDTQTSTQGRLAALLGCSPRKLQRVILELRYRGYIAGMERSEKTPLRLIIRAILVGHDRFIRLSSVLVHQLEVVSNRDLAPQIWDRRKKIPPPGGRVGAEISRSRQNFLAYGWVEGGLGDPAEGRIKGTNTHVICVGVCDNRTDPEIFDHGPLINGEGRSGPHRYDRRAPTKVHNASMASIVVTRGVREWVPPDDMDPCIPADPAARHELCAIASDKSHEDHQGVLTELRMRFSGVYQRYSSEVMENPWATRALIQKRSNHLRDAGLNCLLFGLPAPEFIRYVHLRAVRDGWPPGCSHAPIEQLASPVVADRASTAGVGRPGWEKRYRTAVESSKPPAIDASHSYADTSRLHPGIRPALEAAGFRLSEIDMPDGIGMTDRHLLSVQAAARSLIAGRHVALTERMRAMAEIAAGAMITGGAA